MVSSAIHLILIEDNPGDARLVQEMLLLANARSIQPAFRMVHAERLGQALELLAENDFDLILLDLSLPDSQGLNTLHCLLNEISHTPVVVLSGHSDERLTLAAVQAGAQDYIVKGKLDEYLLERVIRYAIERFRSERAVRQSNAFNQAILNSLAAHIAVLDENGTIVAVNQAWSRFGQNNDASTSKIGIGENYLEVCRRAAVLNGPDAETAQMALTGIQNVLSGLVSQSVLEYPCHAPFEERWFVMKVTSLLDGKAGVVVAHENITERKKAQIALEAERASLAQRVDARTVELRQANLELGRAARLKDEFLATMSHELRTPLNVILGMSEVLNSGVYGHLPAEQERAVGHIHESGHHLLSLINDILDLSKIEVGKLELSLALISVEDICQASLRFVEQMAQKQQVNLSFEYDQNIDVIEADSRRLKQILVNLLTNAVKFTPKGGQVCLQVSLDQPNNLIHFVVEDTGIGIAAHDLPRLFEPFVQIDSSLSRQYEGTGLGLSMVSRLTKMHGGKVSVASEVGKGSRFTVSLPVLNNRSDRSDREQTPSHENMPELSDAVGAETELPHHQTSPVVLLAEDNESNAIVLKDFLSASDFDVVVAKNGAVAIEMARQLRPDIILMDIQMPEMDGLEAIRHLRADTEMQTTPVIALTALAMPGDRERCLAAGANDYLSKPLKMRELVKKLEDYLAS